MDFEFSGDSLHSCFLKTQLFLKEQTDILKTPQTNQPAVEAQKLWILNETV